MRLCNIILPLRLQCNHPCKSRIMRGKVELVDAREDADTAVPLMIDKMEFEDREKALGKLKPGNKFYRDLQILKLTIVEISGKEKPKNPQHDGSLKS